MVTGARKKQGGQYNKSKGARGGSSGLIKAGGLNLKTSLAQESADLTDLVQLYPVRCDGMLLQEDLC